MSSRRAFTLLEMLFSVALFALLVSLVDGSYVYCARTITRCQEGYAPFRDGLRLQKLITRMLASASTSKQRNAKATFQGDEARLGFTTLNRQGNDLGRSYRSAIFYTSDDQRRVAEETIADVDASGLWPGKAVTELEPAGDFWEAEPEHQDYLERYPQGYTCHYIRPDWKLPRRPAQV